MTQPFDIRHLLALFQSFTFVSHRFRDSSTSLGMTKGISNDETNWLQKIAQWCDSESPTNAVFFAAAHAALSSGNANRRAVSAFRCDRYRGLRPAHPDRWQFCSAAAADGGET